MQHFGTTCEKAQQGHTGLLRHPAAPLWYVLSSDGNPLSIYHVPWLSPSISRTADESRPELTSFLFVALFWKKFKVASEKPAFFFYYLSKAPLQSENWWWGCREQQHLHPSHCIWNFNWNSHFFVFCLTSPSKEQVLRKLLAWTKYSLKWQVGFKPTKLNWFWTMKFGASVPYRSPHVLITNTSNALVLMSYYFTHDAWQNYVFMSVAVSFPPIV